MYRALTFLAGGTTPGHHRSLSFRGGRHLLWGYCVLIFSTRGHFWGAGHLQQSRPTPPSADIERPGQGRARRRGPWLVNWGCEELPRIAEPDKAYIRTRPTDKGGAGTWSQHPGFYFIFCAPACRSSPHDPRRGTASKTSNRDAFATSALRHSETDETDLCVWVLLAPT